MRPIKRLLSLSHMIVLSSCSFNFELTSSRTALENQIMGSYRELDDELIVTRDASSPGGDGKSTSADHSTVVARASRNRSFNADDISDLKDEGILGERSDGLIAMLPKEFQTVAKASPEQLKLAEALIDEENRDRQTIFAGDLAAIPDASSDDLVTVKEKFARGVYEKSPKGHWFNSGQKWQQKF